MSAKNPAAVALGRLGGLKGGAVKSARKAASSRENGRAGGRPRAAYWVVGVNRDTDHEDYRRGCLGLADAQRHRQNMQERFPADRFTVVRNHD